MAASDKSTLTIKVDLANPGQFFACCGLLILADAMSSAAHGWFEETRFYIDCDGDIVDTVKHLRIGAAGVDDTEYERICGLKPKARSTEEKALLKSIQSSMKVGGVEFCLPNATPVVVDWWREPAMVHAGFKTWSAEQKPADICRSMFDKAEIARGKLDLIESQPVPGLKPFYFDNRISRLTSRDLGFSPEGFTASFSPAVELFALIGLQHFRPTTIRHRQVYAFATWAEPLPLEAAAIAATGLAPALCNRHYRFPLVHRTGGKYKAFGPAVVAEAPTLAHGDIDA